MSINITASKLVMCDSREGITLSKEEHYERVELETEDGLTYVIGFFTEEGLDILTTLWGLHVYKTKQIQQVQENNQPTRAVCSTKHQAHS